MDQETGQETGAAPRKVRIDDAHTKLPREQRRLALLTRTGLFGTNTFGAEIYRATTLQELQRAYRLVYEMFLTAGYVTPHDSKMRIRTFEAVPDTATFVAKREGQIIGVLSLVTDSPDLGLPSDVAFRKELSSLRGQGLRLGETTNQAMVPRFRKTSVTTQLMRCGFAHSILENRDAVVISISPSHAAFYKLLGFEQITDVRSYSSRYYDPVIMMCLYMARMQKKDPDADACHAFVADYLFFKNPYNRLVEQWRSEAHKHFFAASQLRQLFLVEGGLLEMCTDAEREAVQRRWNDGLYVGVTGPRKGLAKPRPVGKGTNALL